MVKSPRNFELRSVASTALTLFYYGKSFGSWTTRQGVAGTVHYKYLPLCWFVSFLDFSSKTSTQWEGKMSWTRSQRFVNLVENYSYVSSSVNLDANLLCVNTQQIYWPKVLFVSIPISPKNKFPSSCTSPTVLEDLQTVPQWLLFEHL